MQRPPVGRGSGLGELTVTFVDAEHIRQDWKSLAGDPVRKQ